MCWFAAKYGRWGRSGCGPWRLVGPFCLVDDVRNVRHLPAKIEDGGFDNGFPGLEGRNSLQAPPALILLAITRRSRSHCSDLTR